MYIYKRKQAIKDTGKRSVFLLLAHVLLFCSLPIPNQLRSGGSMTGISFKDTYPDEQGWCWYCTQALLFYEGSVFRSNVGSRAIPCSEHLGEPGEDS